MSDQRHAGSVTIEAHRIVVRYTPELAPHNDDVFDKIRAIFARKWPDKQVIFEQEE